MHGFPEGCAPLEEKMGHFLVEISVSEWTGSDGSEAMFLCAVLYMHPGGSFPF